MPVDDLTLGAYDRGAAAFAGDWEDDQPAPEDLYTLLRTWFRPGKTADIGCGSGRDTAWLAAQGFSVTGYDASRGLLEEARRRHPDVAFEHAVLPSLVGLPDGGFANLMCETVIMHLPPADIGMAVARLVELLAPGGTLYLSWRVTRDADQRDAHGRLYAAFDTACVTRALSGMTMLVDEEVVSESSGKVIHRVVARRAG